MEFFGWFLEWLNVCWNCWLSHEKLKDFPKACFFRYSLADFKNTKLQHKIIHKLKKHPQINDWYFNPSIIPNSEKYFHLKFPERFMAKNKINCSQISILFINFNLNLILISTKLHPHPIWKNCWVKWIFSFFATIL